jgi:hypothetical protein
MPGMDGSGPRGLGPGSGWGRGPCGAGFRMGFSRGWWRGSRGYCGYGRPWGARPRGGWSPWGEYGLPGPWGGPASGSPQDEAQVLKEQAAALQAELEAVQRRLAELEKASATT